jgi:acyl-CoA thioesterase I
MKRPEEARVSRQAILAAVRYGLGRLGIRSDRGGFHSGEFIAHDKAVPQSNHAVRMGGKRGVVRHHNERRSFTPVEFQQKFEHLFAGSSVQIAGGFVRKQNRRTRDEGPRQRDTLLFAAGELHRVVVQAIGQPDARQEFAGARSGFPASPRQFRGQQHVLFRGECRNELKGLKHKTDLAPANPGHAVFRETCNVLAVEQNLAARRAVESGEKAQQRAFSASGRPHDGHELPAGDRQIDTAQDFYFMRGRLDRPCQTNDFDNRFRHVCMIMAVSLRLMLLVALAVSLAACGRREEQDQPAVPEPPRGQASVPNPAPQNDTRPVIAAFGDSLSAGFGVEPGKSYPDDLQRLLDAAGYQYRIANLGVSGDTTTDGVERLPAVLAIHPAIVILEFGGNDGLRGLPVTSAQKNLAIMIEALQKAKAQILLAGMTLPRNYGAEYIQSFEKMYFDLASRYKLARIPFLLDGVGGHPDLTQPDGIHPTAEGAEIVANTVMKYLRPLLRPL